MQSEAFFDCEYNQKNDNRETLDLKNTKFFIGQLLSTFRNDEKSESVVVRGSASLI